MKKLYLFLLGLSIFFSSCQKVDLSASYIALDSTACVLNVSDYNDVHGTNYDADELACIADQKFPDVWVFANGVNLGTWQLPCKIPVLEKDSVTLQIFPGIKMNGQSSTRPRYPFVEPYSQTVYLETGKVLQLGSNLPIKYYDQTDFEFVETFNADFNAVFSSSDTNGVNFLHVTDPSNPQNRLGMIPLEGDVLDFEVNSSDMTFGNVIPEYAFLEMSYYCDNDNAQISVSMLVDKSTTSVTETEPLVVVNAGPQWKKIYVNLTKSILRNQLYAKRFRVQLSGGRPGDGPAHYYFDNIKVIYR
ncbi:MAG: hypothetical protein J5642_08280 [Bacteroidales bacterium]|nr:hypothetical protein [Bacteroidales bacterium]